METHPAKQASIAYKCDRALVSSSVAQVVKRTTIISAAILLIPLTLVISILMNGSYVIRGLFDRAPRP